MSKLKFNALIGAFILVILTYLTVPYWTHASKDVEVYSSVVKNTHDSSKYIVFTDKGVFENTDTWFYFKFDSSDLQAKVMRPGKYKISYYGFRVPFFSMYPNLVSAERK